MFSNQRLKDNKSVQFRETGTGLLLIDLKTRIGLLLFDFKTTSYKVTKPIKQKPTLFKQKKPVSD